MNIWNRTEKIAICNVLLCAALCGTALCACGSDANTDTDTEKGDPDSYTYAAQERQHSDAVEERPDAEKYLTYIEEANSGFFTEMNGPWFVDDSDRFTYCAQDDPLYDDHRSTAWRIRLAEMKGTDTLAQAVNRYHEELYESQKALMQERMETKDSAAHTDGTCYCDNIYTLASFQWGNVFTVLDIEEMSDSSCLPVIANFNSITGEKYEFADLFNTADYREWLTEIRQTGRYVADERKILYSSFSFALTYSGLELYEDGTGEVLGFAWEDIEDILTPELISDVVRYSNRYNPYRKDTETWTGAQMYPVFEANKGACAMRWTWHPTPEYQYIESWTDEEKKTEERWFVDDSDRFYYYEEDEPVQGGYGGGLWEIQLGEMQGDSKLAQAVNRYHEELYESRKAQMQEFQEEVTAMDAEDFAYDDTLFWKANANLFTMAAFRWGNLFSVVDMEYVGYKSCRIVPASFHITTGERYEIGDLFCVEDYRAELLRIIEKEAGENEYFYWWEDDLKPGSFTYLISYQGLFIGDVFGDRYVLIKWEDMRDILSPEFVEEVLLDSD